MQKSLLAILFAAAALAQAQPYRVGMGVKPPAVLSKHEPNYTDEARKAGAVTTVVVSIVVNEQGHAENIRVVAPVGMGLDESAIQTVASWQFRPGTKNEQPVPVIANIEVNFRLLNPGSSLIPRRIIFDDPSQQGHPRVKHAARIALSQAALANPLPKCLTAKGTLATDGALTGLHLDPAVSEQAERELLNQLGRWTFEPSIGIVKLEFCAPAQ